MTKTKLLEIAKNFNVPAFKSWTNERLKQALISELSRTIIRMESDIQHHEAHGKAYFWTPPPSASARRRKEAEGCFRRIYIVAGVEYWYESAVNCSCKNVYYQGSFYKNGIQKNVTVLRKALENTTALRDLL